MNVDQHDVNWLVVPFSTMNKTSNMMLTLFEKAECSASESCSFLSETELAVSYLKMKLAVSSRLHFYTPMKLHF